MRSKEFQWVIAGVLFSLLWASASSATKIGLDAAQPLFIAVLRFGIASVIMLAYAHMAKGYRLPAGREWVDIAVYGLLNISIYLGCYVFAMQEVTASIGAIATATNPVFISLMSVFFLKKRLTWNVILSLMICIAGVFCAAWPLLGYATVTLNGLLLLLFSMVSYSLGAIYISRKSRKDLSIITINGWQTLLGGVFLLPITIYFYREDQNHLNIKLWGSVLWLGIPVSIFAAQLWLWLLKINPVKAGFWLFLCPLFGALIAAWLLNDPLTWYTWAGIVLVVVGLLFARK